MVKEVLLWLIGRFITYLPSFLLRHFYPPSKVAKDVKIELRGETPINPSLGSSVPRLDISLEVTNFSNLDLTLDRMLLNLWFGQPVLEGAILKRQKVLARSSNSDIFFRSDLSSSQVAQVEPYLGDSPLTGNISLSIHAYFESKIGFVEVERKFERRKV